MQKYIMYKFSIKNLWGLCFGMGKTGSYPKTWPGQGEPGCGAEHFLVRAMDKITGALEDNRAAVVLTSVNLSKAFNHLGYRSCLNSFAKKGASTGILKILAGFMLGRLMTVKAGKEKSCLRPVNAGAPQGSLLGCYLFNVGIDTEQESLAASADYPACSTPTRVSGQSRPLACHP